jgi:glycosyltransferase involved in cell wall biosynthesis
MSEKIEWLGALDPQETYTLLSRAHVCLLPSSSEGFPFAPLEAQACGCVPIATRLPGITDVAVEHGRTGLLVDRADDAEAFAQAIATLETDRPRWRAMAQAAHERIGSEYRVERMAGAYRRLLEEGWAGAYPLPRPRSAGPPLDPDALTWRDRLPDGLRRAARRWRAGAVASHHGRT